MAMNMMKRISACSATFGLITAFCLSSGATGGCSNAKEGAISGAGIGALSGLVIGSMTGSAGKGAAIGDQNKRRDDAAAANQPPVGPPPGTTVVVTSPPPVYYIAPSNSYATGQALGRLIGQWSISGTIDSGGGRMLPVTGTARGTI